MRAETARARAIRLAEDFLDLLGEGHIEEVWLVGSRYDGTAKGTSDWDFVVVGEDFDEVEEAWTEAGNVGVEPGGVDIIFSSKRPKKGRKVCC